jgi:tRNA(Ile2) C34 agmatinyltransferase TiaS
MASIPNTAKTAAVLSSIVNCVCPECGGKMGGLGNEFKCQGVCQTDWRETWQQWHRRCQPTLRAARPTIGEQNL